MAIHDKNVAVGAGIQASKLKSADIADAQISASAAITSTKVALADGKILVGNASGQAAAVSMSGDATIANTGAVTIGANAVEASMLGANLGKGYVSLDLVGAREISSNDIASAGGFLDKDTTPILERVNAATDKALRLNWAASNNDEIQFAPVPIPGDLDDSSDVTVHLYGKMSGASDTPTMAISVWFGVGDSNAGGNSSAFGSSAAEETLTVLASNVGAHPGVINIAMAPNAHTTDALHLYAAWLEYSRKS